MDSNEKKYFVHPSSIVDEGAQIGEGTKIWHFSHIMNSVSIGKNCILGQNVFVANNVKLGDNVKVQNNVSLFTGVTAEDDVFIGPSAVFTNVVNPRSEINRKEEFKPTLLKRGATIGANSTIVCGVILGEYAFVAAGSVVTRSVDNYELVKGNPARHSGWMSKYGQKLEFNEQGEAICSESGDTYRLKNNRVELCEK